jgi:hypothetical protein
MEYLSYIGWQFQLGPSFDRIYTTFGAYRREPRGTITLASLGFDPRRKHEKLPKDCTELHQSSCTPSEEQSFNEGVRNPAGGVVTKKQSGDTLSDLDWLGTCSA